MPPRHIGPYRVIHALGSGGVSTVYRAVDLRSRDEVALKLLSTGGALDPVAARRLAREFEALCELNHPNVVRVFDAGVFEGYPYLSMELVEGLDLRRYLDIDHAPLPTTIPASREASVGSDSEEVPPFDLDLLNAEMDTDAMGVSAAPPGLRDLYALADAADEPMTEESDEVPFDLPSSLPQAPPPQAAEQPDFAALNRPERIGRLKDALLQICEALAYVHGRGLIHRDLKPANIMVDDDRRVKLMDFGLAKFLAEDSQVTAGGRVVGTYRYMAPEQLLGENLDPRADLYAVGVLIYELIAGRPPFSSHSPLELCQLVLSQDAVPVLSINAGADEQLVRVAHRLLRKEAAERYQTAEEVFQVLLE